MPTRCPSVSRWRNSVVDTLPLDSHDGGPPRRRGPPRRVAPLHEEGDRQGLPEEGAARASRQGRQRGPFHGAHRRLRAARRRARRRGGVARGGGGARRAPAVPRLGQERRARPRGRRARHGGRRDARARLARDGLRRRRPRGDGDGARRQGARPARLPARGLGHGDGRPGGGRLPAERAGDAESRDPPRGPRGAAAVRLLSSNASWLDRPGRSGNWYASSAQ